MYLLCLINSRKSNWLQVGSSPTTPTSYTKFSKLETIYFMDKDNRALVFLAIDVALLVAIFMIYKMYL